MNDFIDNDDDLETSDDLLTEVLERYNKTKLAWDRIHEAYISDLKFADGDQWDERVLQSRNDQKLSSLTYNQIPSKIRYIINNIRSSTPQIKCNPVSNGATKNTAKVFDGLIKFIQYKSNAKHSYINATQNAVTGGIGAFRVNLVECEDYDGDGVNEYEISIDRIQDPTTIVIDPNSTRQDFSDAEYVYVTTWLSKEEFKERWPDAEIGSVDNDYNHSLYKQEQVAILEYWVKNKQTGLAEQYIINGHQILQEPDAERPYPGKYIPIVMVAGEESYIDGERKFKGIVRDIKDMQVLLNLTKSRTGDYIARASNQQWLVEEEMINKYQNIWLNTNVNGASVLPYKASNAGKPERLPAVEPPTGYMQVSQEADNDIRQAIGIRDPLVDIPASQSGKAIKLQISQGNIGTFGFVDNLHSAIKYTGEILVDLIPHIYTEAQIREIMGNDGQITTVQINAPYQENGQWVMHDLRKGKYAVVLDDGPDYQTQREETADTLTEIATKNPQLLQIAGDILFRNLNFEGASEIADRMRAQIPPNILAASSSSNGDPASQQQMLQNSLAQMQQQMQQMQMQNQQMQQIIMQLQQEKQSKVTEIQTKGQVESQLKQLDHEHELRMANVQAATKSDEIAQKGYVDLTLMQDKSMIENENDRRDNHNKIFHTIMNHDLSNQLRLPNM